MFRIALRVRKLKLFDRCLQKNITETPFRENSNFPVVQWIMHRIRQKTVDSDKLIWLMNIYCFANYNSGSAFETPLQSPSPCTHLGTDTDIWMRDSYIYIYILDASCFAMFIHTTFDLIATPMRVVWWPVAGRSLRPCWRGATVGRLTTNAINQSFHVRKIGFIRKEEFTNAVKYIVLGGTWCEKP